MLAGCALMACGAQEQHPPELPEPAPAAQEAARPNVLLILADDLGWKDLGCYGSEVIQTPRLDQLARQGMRFTDAYSPAPICSPARAALLTGMAPGRLHLTNHIPESPSYAPPGAAWRSAPMVQWLDTRYTTLAEHLKSAGYDTGLFGKWHLMGPWDEEGWGDDRFAPTQHGFDINIGGCAWGGPPTFFDPYGIRTLPPRAAGEYLPDRLADEVLGWMSEREQPFFACLWNYAVHWPIEAPPEHVIKYLSRDRQATWSDVYHGMVDAYDEALGSVLDGLDELGLAEDTLVIFVSDNGPYLDVADAAPLRLGKGFIYEGGIRVPMIVRWPGHVQPGTVCSEPVIGMDLFATVLEVVGVEPPAETPLDGLSLVPLLLSSNGAAQLEREALFWHCPNYAWHRSNRLASAVRVGRHKLIEHLDVEEPGSSLELYDLEVDPGETTNLASDQPELAGELRARLVRWRAEVGANMPVRAE